MLSQRRERKMGLTHSHSSRASQMYLVTLCSFVEVSKGKWVGCIGGEREEKKNSYTSCFMSAGMVRGDGIF